uniref:Bm8821 n=1 Tax=Brugia malayi TaxID=6279 RepID=A0A0I9R2Q9_BRUMA|nr:Bm8821 [Brugia malayi]
MNIEHFVLSIGMAYLSYFDYQKCIPDDFQYKYTECDNNGERWRVAVPKMNNLECNDEVPLPIRGVNSFTCGAGMYLDIVTQRCQLCPKGTYSLGDGIRYDVFDEIPANFEVENVNILLERNIDTNMESIEDCPIQ